MKRPTQQQSGGFTLIELMVVVVIVGIIAAFAIPSYTEFVRRGNRADAKSQMLQLANWMQRQYTLNNAYPMSLSTAPTTLQQSPATGTAKFNITLAVGAAQNYTIQAAPAGSYSDPTCGTLTMTNTGVRTKSGTETLEYCWDK